MADRSSFTDDEWKALTEAPLRITVALLAAGPHGPISMVKEAAASGRAIAHPPAGGPADELIRELSREAESREARHDVQLHRGSSLDELRDEALAALQPAAVALQKLTSDEAAPVRSWFVDIAKAVASASKAVGPEEQRALDTITALFAAPST
jgi:hypothetical protein